MMFLHIESPKKDMATTNTKVMNQLPLSLEKPEELELTQGTEESQDRGQLQAINHHDSKQQLQVYTNSLLELQLEPTQNLVASMEGQDVQLSKGFDDPDH